MPPPLQSTDGSRLVGVLLAGTALTLAEWACHDAQFAASLGQTPVASSLLAALGVAIDALALILPCTATVLWRPASPRSVGAWAVWAGAVTVTPVARGFAAGNIGDWLRHELRRSPERAELTARMETLPEAPKEAIAAAERAVRRMRQGPDMPSARDTLAARARRSGTDLQSSVATLAGCRRSLRRFRWRDDMACRMAPSPRLPCTAFRIAGLTVMPATAGLLLSFAWLAWPARWRERREDTVGD